MSAERSNKNSKENMNGSPGLDGYEYDDWYYEDDCFEDYSGQDAVTKFWDD